jgi:ribosome biogenesis protein UTP30
MQVKDTDVKRAIKALLSIQKEESLIEKEEYILVQFSLRRMDNKKRVKPIPIQIANPIYAQAQTCLITKDPQRKYKDLILQHNVKNIAKVVGIQKLKTKFKSYEEKRALCDSYDLFIADERIIEILPRLLGKAFFKKNK